MADIKYKNNNNEYFQRCAGHTRLRLVINDYLSTFVTVNSFEGCLTMLRVVSIRLSVMYLYSFLVFSHNHDVQRTLVQNGDYPNTEESLVLLG